LPVGALVFKQSPNNREQDVTIFREESSREPTADFDRRATMTKAARC
jgi:hypothetical protein